MHIKDAFAPQSLSPPSFMASRLPYEQQRATCSTPPVPTTFSKSPVGSQRSAGTPQQSYWQVGRGGMQMAQLSQAPVRGRSQEEEEEEERHVLLRT
ncbi:hypothetical protein SRHO_G00078660 [Serrasalmus rhombeus]